jgi:hypothetical protein
MYVPKWTLYSVGMNAQTLLSKNIYMQMCHIKYDIGGSYVSGNITYYRFKSNFAIVLHCSGIQGHECNVLYSDVLNTL